METERLLGIHKKADPRFSRLSKRHVVVPGSSRYVIPRLSLVDMWLRVGWRISSPSSWKKNLANVTIHEPLIQARGCPVAVGIDVRFHARSASPSALTVNLQRFGLSGANDGDEQE